MCVSPFPGSLRLSFINFFIFHLFIVCLCDRRRPSYTLFIGCWPSYLGPLAEGSVSLEVLLAALGPTKDVSRLLSIFVSGYFS